MPDFLLCNSKLTFQMTMTPEKTNYFTQGADGVKRLKQGPDLSSYRGLSVIHSRAFAMETGQHPRDILRRRVRTAEYYRIVPHKNNKFREFEFYNEERDTWFSLTFQDLLRYAMHGENDVAVRRLLDSGLGHLSSRQNGSSSGSHGRHNAAMLPSAHGTALSARPGPRIDQSSGSFNFQALGVKMSADEKSFIDEITHNTNLDNQHLMRTRIGPFGSGKGLKSNITSQRWQWIIKPLSFDLGMKTLTPRNSAVWEEFKKNMNIGDPHAIPGTRLPVDPSLMLTTYTRLNPAMQINLFEELKGVTLNYPFEKDVSAVPGTAKWYLAFSFYQEIYKRYGLAMDYFQHKIRDRTRQFLL